MLSQLEEVLLASNGERPEMLLNFLKSTDQPLKDRLIWSQMSVMPRLLSFSAGSYWIYLRATRVI